ncbi:MAG: nitroreductase family protein [Candidatus Bathyarchaeota archaeon]|nr:nitroreductase family protein [Candidatus Bathyarchaeota archaeon]
MSQVDTLKQRRSIRKFQKRPVPMEIIRQILETASFAPSAHNAQPWRFIVLTGSQQKSGLAEAMANAWREELERDHIPQGTRQKAVSCSIERFTSAPAIIVACLSLEDMDKYPDAERQCIERDLAVQSLAAAIQTLLLAAHANSLGTCWYCAPLFCKQAVRRTLEIPDTVEPQALITLGYPDEAPKMPLRRPLQDYLYCEKWGAPFR